MHRLGKNLVRSLTMVSIVGTMAGCARPVTDSGSSSAPAVVSDWSSLTSSPESGRTTGTADAGSVTWPTEATTRATEGGPDLRSLTFWQTVGGVMVEPVVAPPSNLTSLVAATVAVARGHVTSVVPGPKEGVYGRILVTISTAHGTVNVVLLHPPSISVDSLREKLPADEAVFFLSTPSGAGTREEWNCAQYYFCAITWPKGGQLQSALRPDSDVASWPEASSIDDLAGLVTESVRLSQGKLVER